MIAGDITDQASAESAADALGEVYMTLARRDDVLALQVSDSPIQAVKDALRDLAYFVWPDADPDDVMRVWIESGESVSYAARWVREHPEG